jgi:Cu+-exporting ATPase
LIPIAAGVLVPFLGVGIFSWLPFLAAGAMAMSSVTVVSNSLLLGRYTPKFLSRKPTREEGMTEFYSTKQFKQTTISSRSTV